MAKLHKTDIGFGHSDVKQKKRQYKTFYSQISENCNSRNNRH